jgi:hypothetical protein
MRAVMLAAVLLVLWPSGVWAQANEYASPEVCQFAVELYERPDGMIAQVLRESGLRGWMPPEDRRAVSIVALSALLGHSGAETSRRRVADGWAILREWAPQAGRARVLTKDGLALLASVQMGRCYEQMVPPSS